MNPLSRKPLLGETIEVSWADRWQVHHRLQDLGIPSWCATNQPLTVDIANVAAAIQLWSVVRQLTASRQDMVCALERCWQKRTSPDCWS